MTMIDFHTHILPGMDDGSGSVEQSLEMLRLEWEQGVTDVVLTSHFYADENSIDGFLSRRKTALDALTAQYSRDIPRLHLGAEVQYFEGICYCQELHRLCISGTNLLLLEMPMTAWTQRMLDDVIKLSERSDLQIVIAHLDRYMDSQPRKLWQRFLDEDFLIQINASAFNKQFPRLKIMNMLRRGQIHMIGTDCHGIHNRKPDWSKVPEEALKIIGSYSFLRDAEPIIL